MLKMSCYFQEYVPNLTQPDFSRYAINSIKKVGRYKEHRNIMRKIEAKTLFE